jgi:selenocysteine-specific elongation factor
MSGIIGTAGHIDHGKTRLVARLTGVDTDRLPEEKRRGITIALGFAPLELPSGARAGVVDVPGHERFVRTMVAGAAGIDVALLVVAADEGVMPQTREHLEICDLLGVRRGLVALTKTDRVDGELIELARDDVETAIRGTFLEGAPILPCSAHTGDGIEAVRDALEGVLGGVPERGSGARFFLPADRVLSVPGFGTVVTGTVLAGELRTGEELEVLPPPLGRRPARARVRSLQEFGATTEQVRGGQRAAVALSGIATEDIRVGDALARPDGASATRRLSVRLHHLPSRDRPLKTGAKVALHIGTRAVEAGVTLFAVERLLPGEAGLATLRLADPVACIPGQGFILRGFDAPGIAGRTVGGGRVLDPEPPRRRRHDPAAQRILEALETHLETNAEADAATAALVALAQEAGSRGLEHQAALRRLALGRRRFEKLTASAPIERAGADGPWLSIQALDALGPRLLDATRRFHADKPLEPGVSVGELASRLGRVDERVVERAARRAARAGVLEAIRGGFRDPGFEPPRVRTEGRHAILTALEAGGLEPPTANELGPSLGLEREEVRSALAALVREELAVHTGQGLYFARSALAGAEATLRAAIERDGPLRTADAKRLFGVSRKYLIPLLETLDRLGVTVRRGEARELRASRSP